MYFPPYEQLAKAAAKIVAQDTTQPTVTVPKRLFDFLVQTALTIADFDEDGYLAANPDIRAGLGRGNELTAHQHFIGYGYFEGRRGGGAKVDEAWYLQTYPDVAAAVRGGSIKSASDHFYMVGASEGRAPSKAYLAVAAEWKSLLKTT
jgi:hypothetical protein